MYYIVHRKQPREHLINRFRPRLHVQLFVDVVDVRPDCFETDKELIGDFFVSVTFRQEVEQFQFTLC